ncbi:Holliday junction resolvase RuvX [Sandarakinorhabdus sp.]|uniref:Holliday junction resolvase RuvX n=1 Tax=Sandarakinorhabdus sp. TaxID=1916663 RepID=UPI00286DC86E|nr:Holliday junction resolvase RuvX [Sandarakinorhabdus sp.]
MIPGDARSATITASTAEFAAALPDAGRLAGLDPGTKTIGLATCDAGWTYASPHSTIERGKFSVDLARLKQFVANERIMGLVLGLPLSMDGSDTSRTQSVRAMARNLVPLGLPILLWDERWSTQAVERAMIAEDLSRARRAERVDRMAAAYILQGAIDALTRPKPIWEQS